MSRTSDHWTSLTFPGSASYTLASTVYIFIAFTSRWSYERRMRQQPNHLSVKRHYVGYKIWSMLRKPFSKCRCIHVLKQELAFIQSHESQIIQNLEAAKRRLLTGVPFLCTGALMTCIDKAQRSVVLYLIRPHDDTWLMFDWERVGADTSEEFNWLIGLSRGTGWHVWINSTDFHDKLVYCSRCDHDAKVSCATTNNFAMLDHVVWEYHKCVFYGIGLHVDGHT